MYRCIYFDFETNKTTQYIYDSVNALPGLP